MSVRRPLFVALVAACLVVPRGASAQRSVPPVGTRVRIVDVASGVPLQAGNLVRIAGDTLLVAETTAPPTPLVLGTTRRLEVSTGRHRHTLQGIGIGLLVGAGAGAVIGFASYRKPDCSQQWICLDFGPGVSAAAGASLLALPGLVVGGLIGSGETESWQRVETPRVRLGLAPRAEGGVVVGATIAF